MGRLLCLKSYAANVSRELRYSKIVSGIVGIAYNFSETQDGKGACDRKISTFVILEFVDLTLRDEQLLYYYSFLHFMQPFGDLIGLYFWSMREYELAEVGDNVILIHNYICICKCLYGHHRCERLYRCPRLISDCVKNV